MKLLLQIVYISGMVEPSGEFMKQQNIQYQLEKHQLNYEGYQLNGEVFMGQQQFINTNVTHDQTKTDRQIIGALKVNYILYVWMPFILMSPIYTYHMAVSSGDEHKYPHPTITDTACHYPQDIQFRLVMGMAGSFISYIYHVMFKWIKFQKKRTQYTGTIYGWLYYPGLFSVWGYQVAMGTIDGGWYPDLHTQCAVVFFVFLFLIVMSQTLALRQMHKWDSTVLSRQSYVMKSILGVYVAIVWIYCLYGVVTHPDGFGDDQNIYIVMLEYNSVYVCLFWLFSFRSDWGDVHLTFTTQSSKKVQNIQTYCNE